MIHKCHAQDCKTTTPPKLLMCARHWSLVPDVLKKVINSEFNPNQCCKGERPTMAWIKAVRAAINHVRDVEKGNIA